MTSNPYETTQTSESVLIAREPLLLLRWCTRLLILHFTTLVFGGIAGFFWLGYGLTEQVAMANLAVCAVGMLFFVSALADLSLFGISVYCWQKFGCGWAYVLASLLVPASLLLLFTIW